MFSCVLQLQKRMTLVHYAARQKNPEILSLLINHGAMGDVDARNEVRDEHSSIFASVVMIDHIR